MKNHAKSKGKFKTWKGFMMTITEMISLLVANTY